MRRELAGVPSILYMHENQLTYPPPPGSKRDLTYGMIQHLAMLAADRVCLNSAYHLNAWFDELPRLLKHFPDYTHLETVDAARAKAGVLPVGCDLAAYDAYPHEHLRSTPPLVLWNQRWEYDKDPATMLRALYTLADEGVPFRVALAGENFRMAPAEFAEARDRLGDRPSTTAMPAAARLCAAVVERRRGVQHGHPRVLRRQRGRGHLLRRSLSCPRG